MYAFSLCPYSLSSLSAHFGVFLSAYRMERSLGGIGENFGMDEYLVPSGLI